MKATEGRIGRVFVIRLEDGDVVPECLERFAAEQGVTHGHVVVIGGIGGGQVVVGPRDSQTMPPDPMLLPVDGAHEVAAIGVLAPDGDGRPILHIHGALGRSGHTLTGCFRHGVDTWLTCEAILYEIVGAHATRREDERSRLMLLQPGHGPSEHGGSAVGDR